MLENLGTIERRVYRAYWDDGLLDLFAAVGVLAIGLFWLRDWAAAAAIVPVWLVPLWGPTRRRLIEPRLGTVEFTARRERSNARLLKLVLYAGIACLIIGLETYFLRDRLGIEPPISLIAGLPAFLIAIMAVVTSFLVGSRRFIAYGMVLAITAVFGATSDWTPGLILAVAGFAMLLISATVLARFMWSNSPETEGPE